MQACDAILGSALLKLQEKLLIEARGELVIERSLKLR